MEEAGGGWPPRKTSRGSSSMRPDLLAESPSSSTTSSSSSSLSSSSVMLMRGGRVASAISSLQREGGGGGGDGGGRKEVGRGSRGDLGGLGGKGNSMRESRRTGWGASSTTREGFLVRGDSVARGSLRKTDEEQLGKLYKHSVAESDSESTGYASISFSDSDIGSDDQMAGSEDIAAVVVEDKEEEEEECGEGDLEMETVAEGDRDRRQESETRGVSLGRALPPVQVVSKPQGHVGFSSLPDQVKDCGDDVDIVDVGFSSLAGVKQYH